VSKAANQYRIDGTLQTPRGTYQLYLGPASRTFNVTRGEVRYFGTPDLNAGLDIDARNQLRDIRGDNVTVYVHVGGTIQAPVLRLSSDQQPPLSETEIISYLLFGAPTPQAASRGVLGYSAQQGVANLASQLTGQWGSELIADLGVPLDFLEVRPQFGVGGLEATDIALGRRIGDRWVVTLSPRFCWRQQAFTPQNIGGSLEFQMSREWSLLASADPVQVCNLAGAAGFGTQLQLGIDLLWEKRF
jgi:translocation and assembly module TamB